MPLSHPFPATRTHHNTPRTPQHTTWHIPHLPDRHRRRARSRKAELASGKEKESSTKQACKQKEAATKEAVKEEKATTNKQKEAIEADKEKAFTAKLVALKAKEKFAKGNRAQAKVDIQNLEFDMRKVQSESERRDNEKKLSEARGMLFKSDKTNDETTLAMVDIARTLAKAKEGVHKNKAKVKQAVKTQERQDVTNKLDKLENNALEAGDSNGA